MAFELQKQNFALEPLLRQCAQLFDQQCRGKILDLRLSIDPLLPVLLYSDETRLRQILLNLLSNALKFTLHGSILLVALANSSQFGLFSKLECSSALNPLGCGLGLGVSQLLVEDSEALLSLYTLIRAEAQSSAST